MSSSNPIIINSSNSTIDSINFTQSSLHSLLTDDKTVYYPSLGDVQDCPIKRVNLQKMYHKQCIIAETNKDIDELEAMQLNDLEFSYEIVLEFLLKDRVYWQNRVSSRTAGVTPDLMEQRTQAIHDRVDIIMEDIEKDTQILHSDYDYEKLFITEYYDKIRELRNIYQLHVENDSVMVIIYYYHII